MLKVIITVYNKLDIGIYSGMFKAEDINDAVIQYAKDHILEEGDTIKIESVGVWEYDE